MKTAFAAALAGAVLLVSPASAATLIQYNFTGAPGDQASTAASNVAANLTGNAFTRGAGLTATAAANSLNSNGFNNQANDYLSFGFSVASGFSAAIDQLQIGTRSSNTGPGFMNLLVSLDGGAFSTLASFAQNGTADLYQNLTFAPLTALSSIEFRLVAANTTSANGGTTATGGTFRVMNYSNAPFSINGSVSPLATGAVPEPATWAMMLVGFGLLGAGMRRRQTSRQTVRVNFA